MIHRRRILAALAIMTLPVVAHGQRVPPGPPPPPPSRPPMSPPPKTRCIHRHPAVAPLAGAGREVAGAGMVIVGFGPRGDGDGDGGSECSAALCAQSRLPRSRLTSGYCAGLTGCSRAEALDE